MRFAQVAFIPAPPRHDAHPAVIGGNQGVWLKAQLHGGLRDLVDDEVLVFIVKVGQHDLAERPEFTEQNSGDWIAFLSDDFVQPVAKQSHIENERQPGTDDVRHRVHRRVVEHSGGLHQQLV